MLVAKQGLLLLVLLPIIEVDMIQKPTSAVCQIYKRTRQRTSIWGAAMLQPKIPEHTRAFSDHWLAGFSVRSATITMRAQPQRCSTVDRVHFEKRNDDCDGSRRE